MTAQGFDKDSIEYEIFLHMRYKGTDCALMCTGAEGQGEDNSDIGFTTQYGDFYSTFTHKYVAHRIIGFQTFCLYVMVYKFYSFDILY